MGDLARLPIELIPVDQSQVLKAAEFKVVNKIPYVDCVAAALSALRPGVRNELIAQALSQSAN